MKTKTMRQGVDTRAARRPARGWGQVIYGADGSWSWPAEAPRRTMFRFDDSIDDQLRHGIAWSRSSSSAIARAASLSPARIDRFMRGADCLSLGQAARIARLVGLRLEDQGLIEGLVAVWDGAGNPTIHCPENSLARRGWASRRTARARQ